MITKNSDKIAFKLTELYLKQTDFTKAEILDIYDYFKRELSEEEEEKDSGKD